MSWLATWSVGTAPAMINNSLSGDALIHCLKVAESDIILVDEDADCRARIEESRARIEELGMKIIILDADTKRKIASMNSGRPDKDYRKDVKPTSSIMMLFTR